MAGRSGKTNGDLQLEACRGPGMQEINHERFQSGQDKASGQSGINLPLTLNLGKKSIFRPPKLVNACRGGGRATGHKGENVCLPRWSYEENASGSRQKRGRR